MEKLLLKIISPERAVASLKVTQVVLPGTEGNLGVLYGHEHYITTLQSGVVEIYQEEKLTDTYVVSSGAAEIVGGVCTILVDEVVHISEIDIQLFTARLEKLKKDMENETYAIMREELHDTLSYLEIALNVCEEKSYN